MSNQRGFFKGPNDIFEIGLNPYQISLYLYLVRCGNNSDTAFPSLRTIEKKCGMSRPTVTKVIEELEEKGLLFKETRGRKSNIYRVVDPEDLIDDGHDCTPQMLVGGKGDLPPVVNDVNHGGKGGLPYKEILIKNQLKKNNTSLSSKSMPPLFLQEYDSHRKEIIDYALEYYSKIYEELTGKMHPKIKAAQLQRIYSELDNLAGEYDIQADDFEEMIEEFFNTVKKTDYNINHFATEGMLVTLYHRLLR